MEPNASGEAAGAVKVDGGKSTTEVFDLKLKCGVKCQLY